MCKVSQCGVRNVLRDFIFILFWRLRWWSKGILSFKCQMSQRRKKDNLGIRRFWKINGQKKTNNLSIIMTVNYVFFFFTSSPIKFLSCFIWHLFYFEGYKSTGVREQIKSLPDFYVQHSFMTFLFNGYQLVCEVPDRLPAATNRSSLTVKTFWWREVTFWDTTHLSMKVSERFKL